MFFDKVVITAVFSNNEGYATYKYENKTLREERKAGKKQRAIGGTYDRPRAIDPPNNTIKDYDRSYDGRASSTVTTIKMSVAFLHKHGFVHGAISYDKCDPTNVIQQM